MGETGVTKALLGLWPRYLAYVLSFVVIARFWVTHHLAFRLIGRYGSSLAGDRDRVHAQSVQVPLVGWLAVAAVGGDRARHAAGTAVDPPDGGCHLRAVGNIAQFDTAVEDDTIVVVGDLRLYPNSTGSRDSTAGGWGGHLTGALLASGSR